MTPPKTCSICQQDYEGFGNNALPVNDGRCCDECDWRIVIPIRIKVVMNSAKKQLLKRSDL